jgi:membrane protein DedA with SNARE-associated domain
MEGFPARFGALGVLVGAAVEGDVTAILAGVVAHLGLLALPTAIGAACLGAWAGDCAWYAAGRAAGVRLRRSATYGRVAPLVERLAARLGIGEIVLARFVVGTRVVTMAFWGLRGLPFLTFAAVDLVGCALWAAVLVSLGHAASGTAASVLGGVRRAETWVAGALAVAVGGTFALRAVRRRIAV